VNQNPPQRSRVRLGAHWRTVSWSLLDKSLPVGFGVAFLLLVVRALPAGEFALQVVAGAVLLTLSQLLRSLLLVPLIRFVGERGAPERIAVTGLVLYVGASAAAGLGLALGRGWWAAAFDKPDLAAVLVPSACLIAVGSARDAVVATLEGLRRLRSVFLLDAGYYVVAVAALVVWRIAAGARTAVAVQWIQAGAAAFGSLVALVVVHRALAVAPSRVETRRILRFGWSYLGSGFGATLSQQADTLLAGRLMDAPGVAAYGAARLLFRVFNVLGQAVNQVLMPAVARLHAEARSGDLRALFEKSVCFLALGLVPTGVALVLATGPLLHPLFAGRYDDAVLPFQILVAGALVWLPLASVGSAFLTGMGHLRALLWITWAGVVLGIVLAFVWTPRFGPPGAAAAAAVAAVAGMVLRAAVLRPALGFRFRSLVARSRDVTQFARRRGQ
jgi:O-antigen/teichoic acid export membrane protein